MRFAKIESSQYRIEDRPVSDSEILDYMRSQGMDHVPSTIVYDGRMHRFPTDLSKPGDDAGWYSADIINRNIKLVYFGDWRKGVKSRFARGERNDLSENEKLEIEYKIEQHRLQEEAERKRLHEEKALLAKTLWDSYADSSTENGYIRKKGIFPHETKIDENGRLVVPIYNDEGRMMSLQYIPDDGKEKRFLWGTSVKGCFWWLGDPERQRVFLCEGFATAASIHEATGACVFMAFMASALPDTARMLREHGKSVTVIADNDKAGTEWASRCLGCTVITIPQEGEDANDYQLRTGALKDILPDLSVRSMMLMADDILNEDLKVSWLIKGWIPSGSIGMIHGPSASGKTTIMLDMLLSASSGLTDWQGNRIRRSIGVVYLCGEGLVGVKRRIRAWSSSHGIADLGHFAVYPLPLDLDTSEGLHTIREQIRTLGWNPDIIVIDTVNRYMSGDENSAQDTRVLLNCVDALRSECSCSGLYVHHTGNSEETQKRARGSSAWRGALDYEISVNVDDTGTRVIEQVKMKDTELMQPMYGVINGVEIPGVTDEDGEPVTGAVFSVCDAPQSKTDQILDNDINDMLLVYSASGRKDRHIDRGFWKQWLVDNGKVNDLKAAGEWLSRKDANRPIGRLLDAGILTREGDGFYIPAHPKTDLVVNLLDMG